MSSNISNVSSRGLVYIWTCYQWSVKKWFSIYFNWFIFHVFLTSSCSGTEVLKQLLSPFYRQECCLEQAHWNCWRSNKPCPMCTTMPGYLELSIVYMGKSESALRPQRFHRLTNRPSPRSWSQCFRSFMMKMAKSIVYTPYGKSFTLMVDFTIFYEILNSIQYRGMMIESIRFSHEGSSNMMFVNTKKKYIFHEVLIDFGNRNMKFNLLPTLTLSRKLPRL